MRMAPTPNPISAVDSSSRRENTQSGSTGSAARRSANTNAMRRRAPIANAPMLCGEFQAHACPPSSTARISAVSDSVSSTAPR